MNERLERISRLLSSGASRASYIRAKLNVLIPSQIRGLRLKRPMTQKELADSAEMKQSRISAMERPGEVQFNLETLVRLAAAFKVGLKVEFVPFSEMLNWENDFSQDQFDPTPIDRDTRFLNPAVVNEIVALSVMVPVMTTTRFNFNYGEVWTLPDLASQRASAPLPPIDLVAADAASRIDVYGGANNAN